MRIGTIVKIHLRTLPNRYHDTRTIGVVVEMTPVTAKVDWLGVAPTSWSLKKTLEVICE
jgi:hypothetical protein